MLNNRYLYCPRITEPSATATPEKRGSEFSVKPNIERKRPGEDEAFELADRHNIDEYVLRQMLDMPVEEHVEIVRHIINFDLTAKQVRGMCQHTDDEVEPQPELPKHTRQLVKLMKSIGSSNPEDIARGLLDQEADIDVARARLSSLRRLLDEAEAYLKN